MNAEKLHLRAVSLAKTLKQSEAELLNVLILMDTADAFRKLNYPNLFIYCTQCLKLSEAQASYFLKVARKSQEVPALKEAVERGTISLSQARRVAAVITPQNSQAWIEKAASLPQRELERQVTIANPKAVVREKIRPITPHRSELRVGISVTLEKKLQRVREIMAQNKSRAVTLEEAQEEMADFFLFHKDPIVKANRARAKKTSQAKTAIPRAKADKSPSSGRLSAAIRHEVNQRDQGKCQAVLPSGKPCNSAYWTEHHHIKPKSQGGPNTVKNIITLCSQHHKIQHLPGLNRDRFTTQPLQR